jgi:uncharacterized protein (DUF58 family)
MMTNYFLGLLAFVVVMAAAFRNPVLVALVYLLGGVFLAGWLWSRSIVRSLTYRRRFDKRAFLGEEVRIQLELANRSWLPAPWVRIHESLPLELAVPSFFRQVVDLPPRGKAVCEYRVRGEKRGYYAIGPLFLQTGDLFGIGDDVVLRRDVEHITIYPKIVRIPRLRLPAFSPMGTLPFHRPMFEDPSRIVGKRAYQPGDSLRRIDWKSTASSGRLQVRQFEPSISMEVSVFLNLNISEYEPRSCIDATELAIVTAASLASYITGKRQAVGLETNGKDPLNPDQPAHSMAARKGAAYLMLMLEKLARIQADEQTLPFAALLRNRGSALTWGTTQLLITGSLTEEILQTLIRARRWGLRSAIFLTAPVLRFREFQNRAREFGFPLYEIRSDRDLSYLTG